MAELTQQNESVSGFMSHIHVGTFTCQRVLERHCVCAKATCVHRSELLLGVSPYSDCWYICFVWISVRPFLSEFS